MFDFRIKGKKTAVPAAVGRQTEGDDNSLELGLAMSVSHEMERRRGNTVILSTQEYQEDERRRSSLLNDTGKDMFADSIEESSEEEEDVRVESRWVGNNQEKIPETLNEHVGKRPKPTVLLNLQNETVNASRLMVSFDRSKDDRVPSTAR